MPIHSYGRSSEETDGADFQPRARHEVDDEIEIDQVRLLPL